MNYKIMKRLLVSAAPHSRTHCFPVDEPSSPSASRTRTEHAGTSNAHFLRLDESLPWSLRSQPECRLGATLPSLQLIRGELDVPALLGRVFVLRALLADLF